MKRSYFGAIAAVLVAVLTVTMLAGPAATSPVIEKSYGATLEKKDSSPLSVEINEVERVDAVPQSGALDLLMTDETGANTQAKKATVVAAKTEVKQIPLDENTDSKAAQATFQTNLAALMEGNSQVQFVHFLEKTYENTSVIAVLDFAQFLMGPDNPVRSIVELFDWLKNGVKDFRVTMEEAPDAIHTDYTPVGGKVRSQKPIQEFYFHFNDNKGTQYTLSTGVYWDAENKLLYGKDEKGIFALGYDVDLKKLMLYTPTDAWQRNFGFTALYDFFAPAFNMNYITERVKFSYGDYDWMVQIWKGRYTVGCGAELGLYYKAKNNPLEFYNCATDEMMIPMSMQLYFSKQLLLEREEMHHWWLSGFVLLPIYIPQLLTLKGSLTFQQKGMADAFVKAAKAITMQPIQTEQSGAKISFTW